jgi:Transposase, Mutator family
MTATLNVVTKKKEPSEESAEQQAATELVRLAREQGLSLTGPDGLLKQLTKTVLETALAEEMTEHLGYEKHDPAGCRDGEHPQRHPGQDGADRGERDPPEPSATRAASPTRPAASRSRAPSAG